MRYYTVTGPEWTFGGMLQINAVNIQNNFPIQNAKMTISHKGEPTSVMKQLQIGSSGQTETISLPALLIELSLEPDIIRPYSEYNLTAEADGLGPLVVSGMEILAEPTAT